jgi:hypothetical protein
MTFYLQVQTDGTITDAISYPFENYVPVEMDNLPIGISGGWFKFENGVIVEYPELKPKNENEQILELKENQVATNRAIDDNSTAQQGLLELLIDMGVL